MQGTCESSAWGKLLDRLREIDNREYKQNNWLDDSPEDKKYYAKQEAIENAVIPNDKAGIVDFFTYCAPLGAKDSDSEFQDEYKSKAKQVLLKARVMLKDDPELLEEINLIAKQYKIKA